jgi:organic radical activating enzyme
MDVFRVLGCRAVTITGGGEPLLHPDIQKIIPYIAKYLGIEVGLVTNGMLLNKFSPQLWDNVLWCRISNDDSRPLTQEYIKVLEEGLEMSPRVDWAFSHVVSKEPNMDVISDVVEFANRHNFTHIRLVSDLLDLEHVRPMLEIKEELRKRGVDDKLVVYQERKNYEIGTSKCLISLLKPTVGADGNLYPCCGIQYASPNPTRDFKDEEGRMVMGKATPAEIGEIWRACHPFDGSVCAVCYYGEYNRSLALMLKKIQHPNHV